MTGQTSRGVVLKPYYPVYLRKSQTYPYKNYCYNICEVFHSFKILKHKIFALPSNSEIIYFTTFSLLTLKSDVPLKNFAP